MASIESYQQLLSAVAACEDKKAEDVRILALDPTESGLSDYFLICNGTNSRQNVAITDEIEIRLKREFGVYPNSVEGRREGEWVLMDYVDFIVHVFSPEKREYYGLERLRKSATTISPDELDGELKAKIREQRQPKRGKVAEMPAVAAASEPVPAKKVGKKALPAKKTVAKKAAAKKAIASRSAVTKAVPPRKAASTKAPAKKAATKTPAKKAAGSKTPAKRVVPKAGKRA